MPQTAVGFKGESISVFGSTVVYTEDGTTSAAEVLATSPTSQDKVLPGEIVDAEEFDPPMLVCTLILVKPVELTLEGRFWQGLHD